MSQENVEVVRAYYRDLDHALEAYRANPTASFVTSAQSRELLERLDPDVVWKPPFKPAGAFRGREALRGGSLIGSMPWTIGV